MKSSRPQEALLQTRLVKVMGIPAELFQILKDNAVKSATLNMPANLENSAVVRGLEKVSFHSNP